MSVKTALRRAESRLGLGGQHYGEGDCPGPPTWWSFSSEDEPEEPIPPDAPRCRLCGAVHVQHIAEVVVDTREQAEEMIDTLSREAGVKRQ